MRHNSLLYLLVTMLLTTRVFSQGQFVDKGTNAIGAGAAATWTSFATSVGGAVVGTLAGKLDIALSHAVTNSHGSTSGNATGASLSWLFIRRDSATTYTAFHLMYIWDNTSVRGTATSMGLSIGLLPLSQMLQSSGVSIQPSINGALTFPTNGYLIVTYGFELSFLIPVGERTALVPSIAYSRSSERDTRAQDNVGVELEYIFSFSR